MVKVDQVRELAVVEALVQDRGLVLEVVNGQVQDLAPEFLMEEEVKALRCSLWTTWVAVLE